MLTYPAAGLVLVVWLSVRRMYRMASDISFKIKFIFSLSFYPINVFFDNKKYNFRGDLTDISAKAATLRMASKHSNAF